MADLIDRKTTDPFNSTYDIRASKFYPGLLEIVCINKRSDFQIPKEIKGYYTGRDKAQTALNAYLAKVWAFSDAEAEKLAKRAATKKTVKDEDAATA
jgi:hypothetical protein